MTRIITIIIIRKCIRSVRRYTCNIQLGLVKITADKRKYKCFFYAMVVAKTYSKIRRFPRSVIKAVPKKGFFFFEREVVKKKYNTFTKLKISKKKKLKLFSKSKNSRQIFALVSIEYNFHSAL